MHGLLALGPNGPFPRTSQPAWFFHADGIVRILDMSGYRTGLIESGLPEHMARDVTERMREHGSRTLLWATAHGGKRGHANVSWDVRVSTTTGPANESVPAITGGAQTPIGATSVAVLTARAGVLNAYTFPVQPQTLRLPSTHGPRISRALRLPAQIRCHFTRAASASIALGNVGATVGVFAGSLPVAEHALRTLTTLVIDDIVQAGATA